MTPSLLNAQFLGLLIAVIALRAFLPKRLQMAVGPIASAILIGLASLPTLLLLGGVALCWLYPLVLLIQRAKAADNEAGAKRWLVLGVVGLVGLLVAYKLLRDFEIPFLSNSRFGAELIALFGLSYFFFRGAYALYLHYLADLERPKPLVMLYYSLFPPTLTSGPIQKYTDFALQYENPQPLNGDNIATAVYRITRGFFMKLCVAYVLGEIYASLAGGGIVAYESVLMVLLTYIMLFFDFAGYTEIAIGFGLLLGVRVPENFKRPFTATSITEFWRHWHVTLVDALRDLFFVPLGGMRRGGKYAAGLAFLLMVLCGLWHGFTAFFLLWGAYHGLLLFVEGATGSRPMPPRDRKGFKFWRRVVWTNTRVAAGCIFFLPVAEAAEIVQGLGRWM